jgi:hypothetical protein
MEGAEGVKQSNRPGQDDAPRSWVARTGQRTRAIATLAIACVSPAGGVLAFSLGSNRAAFVLLGIAVLSFVAFAATIRCPKCHKSISFALLITRPSARWLQDLFELEACPACNDEGGPAG